MRITYVYYDGENKHFWKEIKGQTLVWKGGTHFPFSFNTYPPGSSDMFQRPQVPNTKGSQTTTRHTPPATATWPLDNSMCGPTSSHVNLPSCPLANIPNLRAFYTDGSRIAPPSWNSGFGWVGETYETAPTPDQTSQQGQFSLSLPYKTMLLFSLPTSTQVSPELVVGRWCWVSNPGLKCANKPLSHWTTSSHLNCLNCNFINGVFICSLRHIINPLH